MTKVLAWQDKTVRRRMFDGQQWFDVEPGEVVVMVVGRGIDPGRVLSALGIPNEGSALPKEGT